MGIMFIAVGVGLLFVAILFIYDVSKKKKTSTEDKEKYIPTTQNQIPIDNIRNGIIKLRNGGYRVVVEIPSVNTELMEAEEQDIVLNQYRQILNGTEFPFQILQQSRTVDISEYRKLLEKKMLESKNNLNRRLMVEFDVFLAQLIKERTIMTKKFFIVIPYDESREVKTVYATADGDKKKKKKKKKAKVDEEALKKKNIAEEEKQFAKASKQLLLRAGTVERSFRQFDISPYRLNDGEIAELFYASYNKERSVYQPLNKKDPSDYTTLRVKTGRGVSR
ncbi:hypothetical protein CN918_27565 [Priestia megaterium]|nr:hypothetical protein CN918_27565 [Priestia megaterium]